MPSSRPGIAVRLWISQEDQQRIKSLAEAVEITQVEIMTRIMHAGVEALHAEGNRLILPMRFSIILPEQSSCAVSRSLALNETQTLPAHDSKHRK